MSQTRNGPDDDRQNGSEQQQPSGGSQQQQGSTQQQQGHNDTATTWFANTAVRAGLTAIGLLVLLFALGQAVGLPLLEVVTGALTSQMGQWLVVAFFALLLIGAAQKATPMG